MAQRFNEKLYYITPIGNVPSMLEHGILSYRRARAIKHMTVAMSPVQDKRDKKSVPNGLPLHDYANLYFNPRNAMMYVRKAMVSELCIVVVAGKVLEIPNVVVADRNAAAQYVRFLQPTDVTNLNFDNIYAKNWNHNDFAKKDAHKKEMCAEVLVPDSVPSQAIQAIYVGNEVGLAAMTATGYPVERTYTKPYMFFL